MNTANALGYFLGALACPWLMRRFGPSVLLVAGSLLASVFMVGSGFVTQTEGLLAQRLLAGMASALVFVAGGLLAQTTGFASLDLFAFDRSADLMLMLVIGGVGWLYGGVVGAVVFKLMHDVISGITPQYWTFWIGLFLVVLVMVGRERLIRPWLWFGRAADVKGGAQ